MFCLVSVVWVNYNNSGIEPNIFIIIIISGCLFIVYFPLRVHSYYDWTFIPSIQMLKTQNQLFCF